MLGKLRASWRRYRLALAIAVPATAAVAIAIVVIAARGSGSSPPSPSPSHRALATATPVPKQAALIDGVLIPNDEFARVQARLPLAVILDNLPAARPQQNLDRAELVYEVVAEGGITRFLAVYWRNDVDLLLPVRSARVYYLPWVLELDGIFAHFGRAQTANAADVPSQVRAYGLRDLDGLVLPGVYWRVSDRPGPHNAATSTASLWDAAASRQWLGPPALTPWPFKDDLRGRPPPPGGKAAPTVSLSFGPWSKSSYDVAWQYDPGLNAYRRHMGGAPHSDGASGQQIVAKNVAVQFVELDFAGDGVHLLFDTVGEGEAVVFQDGVAVPATWRKPDPASRTRFYDGAGNEIPFVRGATWVETLAYGSPLAY